MQIQIRSFKDILDLKSHYTKPLVLFSGGLDGSYIINWLKQNAGFPIVHALSINLGGNGDILNAEHIANKLGAKFIYRDLQREFADEFVALAIQAQARYLNQHPISASLSRPLIAKEAVKVAQEFGCNMIIHSATASQNSLRRFNGAFRNFYFDGIYGSPFELNPVSRTEKAKLDYQGKNIFEQRKFSADENLWCREFEGGCLDNIEKLAVPEELFTWTSRRPDQLDQEISIGFEEGVPMSVDGREYKLDKLIYDLQQRIGSYGIGRYIALEELEGGIKFPEIREMPAANILLDAYRHLESGILSAETIREKMILEQIWVKEAVEGQWSSLLHLATTSFIKTLAKYITGKVSYILSQNKFQLTGIQVERPLYHPDRDLYEQELLNKHLSVTKKLEYSTF